jgi:hypothetical protein
MTVLQVKAYLHFVSVMVFAKRGVWRESCLMKARGTEPMRVLRRLMQVWSTTF